MKKLFLLCLVAAAAAFVSCSKEDGDGAVNIKNLVGRWSHYKNILERGDDVRVEEGYEDEVRHIYEFKADGTGSEVYMEKEDGEWRSDEEVVTFTYTLHENKLYIVETSYSEHGVQYDDDLDTYSLTIEKLTANEMVFIDRYENDGEMQTSRDFLRRI